MDRSRLFNLKIKEVSNWQFWPLSWIMKLCLHSLLYISCKQPFAEARNYRGQRLRRCKLSDIQTHPANKNLVDHLHNSYTTEEIHDSLCRKQSTLAMTVLSWNSMEFLPFRGMGPMTKQNLGSYLVAFNNGRFLSREVDIQQVWVRMRNRD